MNGWFLLVQQKLLSSKNIRGHFLVMMECRNLELRTLCQINSDRSRIIISLTPQARSSQDFFSPDLATN